MSGGRQGPGFEGLLWGGKQKMGVTGEDERVTEWRRSTGLSPPCVCEVALGQEILLLRNKKG